MYKIKSEDFSLELTPIVQQVDFSYPVANSLRVQVLSQGFSVDSIIDIDEISLADFAIKLHNMYKTLKGTARLEEPYSLHCFIEFTAKNRGYIGVKGYIHNKLRMGCEQEIRFENEFDQTYLKDFADSLFADYAKYTKL